MDTSFVACAHLKNILNPETRKIVLDMAIADLAPLKDSFDAIAYCGNSGALIVPSVADALGKPIILVRKLREHCNSHEKVEGVLASKYIIIDDLVCSGDTLKFIMRSIRKNHYGVAKCIGVYLYAEMNRFDIRNPAVFTQRFGTPLLNKETQ